MSMVKEKPRGRRPSYKIEPSPYDLRKPLEVAPQRMRHDPRIPDQRLTAFWVTIKGRHVGRVVMTEFEDKTGWYYQPEVFLTPTSSKTTPVGEPLAKRRDAVEVVVDEYRTLELKRRRQSKAAAENGG